MIHICKHALNEIIQDLPSLAYQEMTQTAAGTGRPYDLGHIQNHFRFGVCTFSSPCLLKSHPLMALIYHIYIYKQYTFTFTHIYIYIYTGPIELISHVSIYIYIYMWT